MKQVQIFIDKDEWKGTKPLHEYILEFLIGQGIAGATSFVGHSAFGRHHRLKQPNQHYSFDETPMLITFIDEEKKVKETLTDLRKLYRGGFIAIHSVEQW